MIALNSWQCFPTSPWNLKYWTCRRSLGWSCHGKVWAYRWWRTKWLPNLQTGTLKRDARKEEGHSVIQVCGRFPTKLKPMLFPSGVERIGWLRKRTAIVLVWRQGQLLRPTSRPSLGGGSTTWRPRSLRTMNLWPAASLHLHPLAAWQWVSVGRPRSFGESVRENTGALGWPALEDRYSCL